MSVAIRWWGVQNFQTQGVVNLKESLIFQMGSIYIEFQNPDPL